MKRKMTNFGFSTLLIGFTMLCIVIFSVLALITANSDYNLSRKYADKNTSYYEAENTAYILLSQIDSQLYNIYKQSINEEEYYNMVTSELTASASGYFEANEDGSLSYTFDIEMSQLQTLQISIQICYPLSANDNFYRIKKWQLITDTSIEEEDTLNLIR